jgi:hypothetical protein
MATLTEKKRDSLSRETFAFPKERKEPLTDPSHVRDAVARFDPVKGVTNEERDAAWRRAARKYGVEIKERGWRELFRNSGKKVPSH